MAILLKVEVKKIYLYPLGGISKFFLPLNASYKKEFLILISGPIFQQLAKYFLIIILPKEQTIINIYHYGILFFNLLPIYPLDGGKLMNMFFSKFSSYKSSLYISVVLSYIMIILILIFTIKELKLNIIVMLIFLITKVYAEQNKVNYIYEKFLLERYLNNYNFKNSKIITNTNAFYKNKSHIIKENNKYFLEKEYLIKKYQKS